LNACVLQMASVMVQQPTLEQEGDRRLSEWSKWQRGDYGTGYPTIAPFARLVTPSTEHLGDLPEEVAETDKAVCILKHRTNGILFSVIEQHYLKADAVDVKARVLGKSRAGFYRLVARARVKVVLLVKDLRGK
jgi:hypothetical protein